MRIKLLITTMGAYHGALQSQEGSREMDRKSQVSGIRRFALQCSLALALFSASGMLAYGQAGGSYDLSWFTVDSGGATSSSGGSYSLGGTIGQPDAGLHVGGQYNLQAGFWTALNSSPSPTATLTLTSTVTAISTSTTTATATATASSTSTATYSATSMPSSTPTSAETQVMTATASATTTVSPTPTQGCIIGQDYILTQSTGATTVPSTTYLPGSSCDACTVLINLPFSYSFYGTPYTEVRASSKGNLQFASDSADGNDQCLPNGGFNDTIFAYWDDMSTNINEATGIFTSVSGHAPNRVFNIEWRAGYATDGATANFQVRLYEGQPRFDTIYGQTRGGYSATVGAQKGTGERLTQYACNTRGSIKQGLMLTFDMTVCPLAPASATPVRKK